MIQQGIQRGRTVLLAVDVQGTRKIRKVLQKRSPFVSIFILPPSLVVLRERLEGRKTDLPKEVEKRIQRAEEEIKAAREYDATVINHNLDQTVHEIEKRIDEFEKKLKGGK